MLYCLTQEHDPRLLALATVLCLLTALAATLIMDRANQASPRQRRLWLAAAGFSSGLGVWATHFVAMLGYNPGISVSYNAVYTTASLLSAMLTATCGFLIAGNRALPAPRVMGGTIVGFGFALMHYGGMLAVEMPAIFRWSAGWIAVSLILAVAPMVLSLTLGLGRSTKTRSILSGAAFLVAILGLHFSGMTAATVIPSAREFNSAMSLRPAHLALMITAATLIMLIGAIMTAVSSLRVQRVTAAREREFRILVQGISDYAIYLLTTDGRIASWNAGAARLKGYSEEEVIGQPLEIFYSAEDREAGVPANGLAMARDEGRFSVEGWRLRKDGSRFWAHVTIEPLHNERGQFHGFAKITRDMTARKIDQDRLLRTTTNLDAALSNMHQGLCLYGEDDRLILWNRRFCELYGLAPDALEKGMTIEHVLRLALSSLAKAPVSDARVAAGLAKLRACLDDESIGSVSTEYESGLHVFMAHRRLADGGWVSTFEDVTEHRRSQARIAHMALHDDLTGLPNRSHFNDSLERAIANCANDTRQIAVAVIDLDRFKEVNDTWGHASGDALLRAIADKLRTDRGDNAFFARLGGDEFAAYYAYETEPELQAWIDRLALAFRQTIEIDACKFSAGASIGVALYPSDGESREQVLNNADFAMYRAKALIGSNLCFYERGMDEKARTIRQLANDLRHAIDRNELSLAFQDQRSLSSNEVVGYEALLRWNHSQRGAIPPSEFIPIAEQSGEILAIGAWVLREACKQAAAWPKPLKVAVNLSPIQLTQSDLVETVIATLAETGLSPHRL